MIVAFIAMFHTTITAQISLNELFNGVSFNDKPKNVIGNIKQFCDSIYIITPPQVSFPLADSSNTHIICQGISLYDGFIKFEEAAFTFANKKLVQVQVKGEAVNKILNYSLYDKYKVLSGPEIKVLDEKESSVWFITEEGKHTNLFTWDNPYLLSNIGDKKVYNSSAKVPDAIKLGVTFSEIKDSLNKISSFIQVQKFGDVIQANCFGIEYAGFPRKFELRFEKGKLETIWILTAKQEENRIRKALEKAYGAIIYSNDEWDVFHNWEILLRKKHKPEILLLSREKAIERKREITQNK